MWALHKLKSNKRKREGEEGEVSVKEVRGKDTHDHSHLDVESEVDESGLKPRDGQANHLSSPWGFKQDELRAFPALQKRNFWCIQRHQARAHHYDLRMQLDGTTFSWAIPRGLLGLSKMKEKNRLAVETTLHPISYTTYEGGDGRILPSGERCGTWFYTIDYPWKTEDSDSEQEKRQRRQERRDVKVQSLDESFGTHEEDKFRMAMRRPIRIGKSRSIHFTLRGGQKMTNHSYILIQSPQSVLNRTFSSGGKLKVNWFISLPKGVEGYPWDSGGEEGEKYGRSVKSNRTLRQVCAARERIVTFDSEKKRFANWQGDVVDVSSRVRLGFDGKGSDRQKI